MGLTHYWDRLPELEATVFESAVTDIKKVFDEFDIPLAGGDGEGKPVLTKDEVCFNGAGEDSYETFSVRRVELADPDGKVFNFCKTARKSYDVVVRAVLIIFSKHMGNALIVASDDDNDDPGWIMARTICENVLGYGDNFTLEGG